MSSEGKYEFRVLRSICVQVIFSHLHACNSKLSELSKFDQLLLLTSFLRANQQTTLSKMSVSSLNTYAPIRQRRLSPSIESTEIITPHVPHLRRINSVPGLSMNLTRSYHLKPPKKNKYPRADVQHTSPLHQNYVRATTDNSGTV